MRPHEYGVRITGPGMAYEYVYDETRVDLKKIAYDFEYELDHWPVDPQVYQELVDLVGEWQRRYRAADRPFLYYSKAMDYVTVYDGRNPEVPTRQRFDWPEAGVIEACNEAPKSRDQIAALFRETGPDQAWTEVQLTEALARLTARRVLYEERGKYFTLAIPENPYL
jgi:hypothetical protein